MSRRSPAVNGGILGVIWRFFCQKFTIMLIPHSEKGTIHFHVSLLLLLFIAFLLLGLIVGFFWFSLDFSGNNVLLATRSQDLSIAEASLDIMREEIGELVSSAGRFRTSLAKTIEILGIEDVSVNPSTIGGGDLATLFMVEQNDSNTVSEVTDLKNLRVSLENSVVALEDIGSVLSNQKNLLFDIPAIWPLGEMRARVTQTFGPSTHPFGHYWYIHRGVDLAANYGTPIVATASGKVVKKDFDKSGFGYYIDIQHRYGFKTRYAHLQRQLVDVGQWVTQGDVIGLMGSTGLSTGSHLHYEVMIGTQLVDPIKFFNMTSANSRGNVTAKLRQYQ